MRSTRSDFSCEFQRRYTGNRKNKLNVNEKNENFSFKPDKNLNPREPVALILDRLEPATPHPPTQCWSVKTQGKRGWCIPTLNGGGGGWTKIERRMVSACFSIMQHRSGRKGKTCPRSFAIQIPRNGNFSTSAHSPQELWSILRRECEILQVCQETCRIHEHSTNTQIQTRASQTKCAICSALLAVHFHALTLRPGHRKRTRRVFSVGGAENTENTQNP